MNHRDLILDAMRRMGKSIAKELQEDAKDMTGTQLYAQEDYVPSFTLARARVNMLKRPAGLLCRSSAGRIVKLLQPYDSDLYPQEPEELPAQWGFYWSSDPAKALPFVSIATSPYGVGDCCTHEGRVWRSGQAGNVWAPGTPNVKWDDLGPVEN